MQSSTLTQPQARPALDGVPHPGGAGDERIHRPRLPCASASHRAPRRRLRAQAVKERADLVQREPRLLREPRQAFRFAPDAFEDVARFVGNERKCCPFLDFEIGLPAAGPRRLRLTGPAGTRAFLEAELSLPAG